MMIVPFQTLQLQTIKYLGYRISQKPLTSITLSILSFNNSLNFKSFNDSLNFKSFNNSLNFKRFNNSLNFKRFNNSLNFKSLLIFPVSLLTDSIYFVCVYPLVLCYFVSVKWSYKYILLCTLIKRCIILSCQELILIFEVLFLFGGGGQSCLAPSEKYRVFREY